jgi:shikimate kinase
LNRIFLIGFMGSGKSTLGKELAAKLQYTFIETDLWIEQQENKTITEIFSEQGENGFREKEKEFLGHLQLVEYCVIATGGGMPCFEDNIEQMNRLGTTIWLDVEEPALLSRLEKETKDRPLLSSADTTLSEKVDALLAIRKPFYTKAQYKVKQPTAEKIFLLLQGIGA